MTATVTALIELAVDLGFGIAFLVVGTQVLLDRLNPVEFVVSHVLGARRSAQGVGAHRRGRDPRPAESSRFTSNLARHRNEPVGCMK
jgi:hypothetical protein